VVPAARPLIQARSHQTVQQKSVRDSSGRGRSGKWQKMAEAMSKKVEQLTQSPEKLPNTMPLKACTMPPGKTTSELRPRSGLIGMQVHVIQMECIYIYWFWYYYLFIYLSIIIYLSVCGIYVSSSIWKSRHALQGHGASIQDPLASVHARVSWMGRRVLSQRLGHRAGLHKLR